MNLIQDLLEGKKYPTDLLIIIIFSILGAFAALSFPDGNALRVAFGVPLLLFIPGYSLVSVLWPTNTEKGIGNLERIALSIGLSITIVAILGLLLSYTINFTLSMIVASNVIITFLLIGLAFYRRYVLPDSSKYVLNLSMQAEMGDKVFVGFIAAILVISVCLMTYMLVKPSDTEAYSELYILDSNGRTDSYPVNVSIYDISSVIVGIGCFEQTPVNYTIIVGIENATEIVYVGHWNQTYSLSPNSKIGKNITLAHENFIEESFSFNLPNPGRYKVTWELLIEGQPTDYEVHLWIDVS